MHYILSVRALGLCAQAARTQHQQKGIDLDDRPCVVHADDEVWDVDALALVRNLRPGMTLREAKTILRTDGLYIPYNDLDFRPVRDAFLSPFLDYVDQIEAGKAGEAYADLSRHPNPLEIAGLLLQKVSQNGAIPIQAGIAPARWIARLSAQIADPSMCRIGLLPIEAVLDPTAWLAHRDVAQLTPVPQADRTRLSQLGFGRAGLIQQAPLERIESQFPRRGAFIMQTAQGILHDPVRPNYPSNTISAARKLTGGISRLELESALKEMSRELAALLSHSDRQAGGIRLTLAFEDGLRESYAREFPKAVISATQLSVAAVQALGKINIDRSVEELRILLTGLYAAPNRQEKLANFVSRDPALLPSTIKRLNSSLGDHAVRRASDISYDFRDRVLKEWKNATGWK